MLVVTLPYDPEWRALAWAKEHCPSYITNYITNNAYLRTYGVPLGNAALWGSKIDYYFAAEEDATFFALRWTNDN